MRHQGLRMILAVLAAAAMLAGCAQDGGQSGGEIYARPSPAGQITEANTAGASGMFVQSVITPESDAETRYTRLNAMEDGSLLLVGMDAGLAVRAFTGDGGGEWEALENPAAAQYMAQQGQAGIYPECTVASDGTWWFIVNHTPAYSPEGVMEDASSLQAPRLVKIADGGQPQEYDATPGGALPEEFYTSVKMVPGPGGTVYALMAELISYSKFYWVAFDGETGKETARVALNPEIYEPHSSIIKGSSLYVPNTSNSMIEVYSMQNGQKTDSFSIPKLDFGWESVCFDIAENGDFCYADSAGIHRVARGGTLVQNVVSGTQFVFSSPEYWGDVLVAAPDGSYLLLARESRGDGVYRFVFDPDATVSAENMLKVWALADSQVLRAAVAEYGSVHPDAYVSVEYGRTGDATGATDADIIRTLNTRLLAGDVPDVLILDGLPIDAYIGRGLLADLTGVIDTSGCYENIMQAYSRDGKVYGVPALFQMPVFISGAGDGRAGGVGTLAELAQTAAEPGALHYGSYAEMFESLYMAYGGKIFPGAAGVDEAALRDFLENTKAVSDALGLTNENSYVHGGMGTGGIPPRQGLYSFVEGNSGYAADILYDPIQVTVMYMMSGAKAFTPLPGGSYIPVCGGAVPAGAAHAENAAAFIELMLKSEIVQDLRMEQGFSVRVGQHLAYHENSAEQYGFAAGQGPADIDWDGLIGSFSGPAVTERALYLTLYAQAERLYRGEISHDGAADAVLQNTKLYFEERA